MLMPSAKALYYLTHLDEKILPDGNKVSELMTRYMTDMDDGIGIRTRKRIASHLVMNRLTKDCVVQSCLSLACGAADLMLEAISGSKNKPKLRLVDMVYLSSESLPLI